MLTSYSCMFYSFVLVRRVQWNATERSVSRLHCKDMKSALVSQEEYACKLMHLAAILNYAGIWLQSSCVGTSMKGVEGPYTVLVGLDGYFFGLKVSRLLLKLVFLKARN